MMALNDNHRLFFHQQQQQQHQLPIQQQHPHSIYNHTNLLNHHLDNLDYDANLNYHSLSSSPISTQSLLSHSSGIASSSLSPFDPDSILDAPSFETPRAAYEPSLFGPPRQSSQVVADPSAPLFPHPNAMQTETWATNGQLTPRSLGRFTHHRESSRSSLGSNGPMSPFSHNISNPQIAVNDSSVDDSFHSLHGADDLNYQLAPKSYSGITHDNFYTGLPSCGPSGATGISTYPYVAAAPKRRNDRGLLQPSEIPIGSGRSQPVSVASSITADSPVTPAGEPEDMRKNNTGELESDIFAFFPSPPRSPSPDAATMHTVPKLERTMTDVFNDELYNPNFTITPSSGQARTSPTSELFNQRLQAANSQHLSAAATHSPILVTAQDRSPFRQGSPLAPVPLHEFPSAMGPAQMRFGSAQQMREQNKAMRDAQVVQQQIARTAATSTPQTISPKDAMLEFHEPEGDANFPLFPQQNTNGFNADAISRAAVSQSQPAFDALPLDTSSFNLGFLGSQLPTAPQMHPQYSYMAQPRPQSAVPSVGSASVATTRLGSADTGITDSVHSGTPQRPDDIRANGGTYTCTYHGCTLRFATPALLQKHKREGHRQAHGLNGPRRPEPTGMTSTLLNTQAGPHRCDRLNPSTGKPCNAVFSRPYDLTRHEGTIHNPNKQKVRCDLCTDDKTFSRADALTRHYKVCHPDVEFPGKHRRRGGHSG
ncbi:hypothetical protein N0V88_000465 [Collariella sp. IMI 366227]|nr:hypothetical protein N0V88_000465 [Collariella sp. IMI 366227]